MKILTAVVKGPWWHWIEKSRKEYKEHNDILTRSLEYGWGNGYVAIPKEHPFFGKSYDEIDSVIDVHGGITFSKLLSKTNPEFKRHWDIKSSDMQNWWVFGFDTGHYGDDLQKWPKKAVEKETKRFAKELFNVVDKLD